MSWHAARSNLRSLAWLINEVHYHLTATQRTVTITIMELLDYFRMTLQNEHRDLWLREESPVMPFTFLLGTSLRPWKEFPYMPTFSFDMCYLKFLNILLRIWYFIAYPGQLWATACLPCPFFRLSLKILIGIKQSYPLSCRLFVKFSLWHFPGNEWSIGPYKGWNLFSFILTTLYSVLYL